MPLGARLAHGRAPAGRALGALALVVLTGVLAWTVYQPLRALNAGEDSLALLEAGRTEEARAAAVRAHDIDPLSAEPLYDLAVIESAAGRTDAAGAALERAVALQPENPTPWLRLADFQLAAEGDAQAALRSLGPALALDPRNTTAIELFLQATRQGGG
jgi:tetratricopeptide (TPR) repeat protein